MEYKVPKIFTSRSRNPYGSSSLHHAGTEMLRSSNNYQQDNMVGQPSFGTAAQTQRFGSTTARYSTQEETKNGLMSTGIQPQSRAQDNGLTPHFFQQVKDLEGYVTSMNQRPATMLSRDFPYLKTYAGKEVQYDVDFFIRQASTFDVLYKKTWNLLEKMKYKLDQSEGRSFASIQTQNSATGPSYILQWEDDDMYAASKKVLTNENELSAILKKLPKSTMLFDVRHPQLQEVIQFRIDIENIIFKMASKVKGTAPYSQGVSGSLTCNCQE